MTRQQIRTSTATGPADTLLERADEVSGLIGASAMASRERGSVVVIGGPPGSGKSRLLAVGREIGAERGMRVLSAAGRSRERQYAFGVVVQLFEAMVTAAAQPERERLLAGAGPLAARLLVGGPDWAIPSEDEFALEHGLYRLCASAAEHEPLLLSIDDAHFADRASLSLVFYLAQRIGDLPIMLLLGVGSERSGPAAELLDDIALDSSSTLLELDELSEKATAKRVRETGFPSADDEFCRACYEVTRGNPFLLTELLVDLGQRGMRPRARDARRVPGVVPASVSRAILSRIRTAGPGASELAAAVAVLGGDVQVRHAAHVAGLDPAEAAAAAGALAKLRILDRAGRLSFVHPIVRAAVYAEQAPTDRAEAHLRAAEQLREEDAAPEHVAAQLVPARRSGSAWAVDALCEAAAHASERGEPTAAVTYLRRALDEPPARGARAHVLLELGRAEAVAGNPVAKDRLAEAMTLIEDPHDRASAAFDLGSALYSEGRPNDAAAVLAEARSDVGETDPELLTQLEVARATCDRIGKPRESREPLSLPSGPEAGSSTEQLVLAYRAFDGALRGAPQGEVIEAADGALAGPTALEDETLDELRRFHAGFALIVAGCLEKAEERLTHAVEDARRRGSVVGCASAAYLRSWALLRQGRLEAAEKDARTALSARRHGVTLGAHAVTINCLLEREDLDGAGREVTAGRVGLRGANPLVQGMYLAARGRWRLLTGSPQEALSDCREAGRRQEAIGVRNPAIVSWRSDAALAAAQLGNDDEAEELIDEELRLARDFGAPGQIGRTLHTRAHLADNGHAVESFRQAVSMLEKSEAKLDRARALIDLGSALRRVGQRRAAREPLRRGLDWPPRIGATRLTRRARQELLAAGARPRRTALRGVESLTERERQVAELAGQGMSNRQIAENLVVTIKTVEWHLRNAYRKLEVRGRPQLEQALGPARG